VLAGLYTFGGAGSDTELLARIGSLAQLLGAPFLAAAAPSVVGMVSFESDPDAIDVRAPDATWLALRRHPAARWVGVALPRFLLRLPYDPDEEPVEQLALSEMSSPPSHPEYLWGNPALVCALLLGAAFTQAGWELRPGQVAEVDDLPLHLYRHYGTTATKPCAEALLSDRSAALLLDSGLMPLLSQKDGAAVRVARFQSVAEPIAALAGSWAAAHA
jgi:type VI secretion system protein ImpC